MCSSDLENGEYGTFAKLSVADLRTAFGRYPHDPGVTSLVDELSAGSERFRTLWDLHHVEVRRGSSTWMRHPVVGAMEVHCDVLLVPERDQKVVLYTVEPGTPSHEAFRLLRVIGTQDLSPR